MVYTLIITICGELAGTKQFEEAFRRWLSAVLPVLFSQPVTVDGKTNRRSKSSSLNDNRTMCNGRKVE